MRTRECCLYDIERVLRGVERRWCCLALYAVARRAVTLPVCLWTLSHVSSTMLLLVSLTIYMRLAGAVTPWHRHDELLIVQLAIVVSVQ